MARTTRAAAADFGNVRSYTQTVRLNAFVGVAAAATMKIAWSLGMTYHGVMPRFTIAGVPATQTEISNQVANITLRVAGDPKMSASGAEWIMRGNFWGGAKGALSCVNDGILTLALSLPWEQEIGAQDGPAYGLATGVPGGVDSATIEITLAAGATIDAIEAFGEVSAATVLGRHICLRRESDSQAAAGPKVMSDWNTREDYQVLAFHVNKSGGTSNAIREVELTVDRLNEIQRCAYGHVQARFRRYGFVQQTGWTHIPFDVRGRPLDGLPMAFQDMRLTLDTTLSGTALGNFDVILEQLEGVDPAPLASSAAA